MDRAVQTGTRQWQVSCNASRSPVPSALVDFRLLWKQAIYFLKLTIISSLDENVYRYTRISMQLLMSLCSSIQNCCDTRERLRCTFIIENRGEWWSLFYLLTWISSPTDDRVVQNSFWHLSRELSGRSLITLGLYHLCLPLPASCCLYPSYVDRSGPRAEIRKQPRSGGW